MCHVLRYKAKRVICSNTSDMTLPGHSSSATTKTVICYPDINFSHISAYFYISLIFLLQGQYEIRVLSQNLTFFFLLVFFFINLLLIFSPSCHVHLGAL